MQVQTGGDWIFTMHGPDGNNNPNKILFREVVKHKKLLHEYFEPNFFASLEFESQGDKTLMNWYKLYETKELFELVEIHYKTNEGFKQTIARLENYLLQQKIRKVKTLIYC